MSKITCNKNHSGTTHLTPNHTRNVRAWECDGCGQMYVKFVVEAKPGMTPFATEASPTAAIRSSNHAKRLGLSGRIIPV
mgnify:CR=1 FL=1